ncbi:hypothetical protein [Burkholderia ubonensis]|uniref:hypothetical protein n=1 Tax=Burkholderia ubonensis TaxID=101571 RepID=UPI000AE70423|nr:hypothetical protein [Burkholderia ubonensis]
MRPALRCAAGSFNAERRSFAAAHACAIRADAATVRMIDAPLGDYRARHAVARVADGPTGGSGDLAFANAEDSATGAQKP